jgi:hypothetical protein
MYREAPDASSRIAPPRLDSAPTRRCGIPGDEDDFFTDVE